MTAQNNPASFIEFDPRTGQYFQVNTVNVGNPFTGISSRTTRTPIDSSRLNLAGAFNTGGAAAGTINPADARNDPVGTLARVTRGEFATKTQTFDPFVDEVLAFVNNQNAPAQRAQEAGTLAETAIDATRGIEDRTAARYGLSTAGTRDRAQRDFNLDRSLASASAANTALFDTKDLQDALGVNLLGVGRGVQTSALGQLGAAAAGAQASEANRVALAQQRRQASQARTQSAIGSAVSLGGMGLSMGKANMLGAGIGAAKGAALGGAAGLLLGFI